AAGPAGRASAHTTGAARRTPAPSRTPPPRPGPPETPPPGRPHSPATPSSRSRARRARSARRCYPRAPDPAPHPAPPAPRGDPAARCQDDFRTRSLLLCPSAQLATAADVISVGHWNDDHRWPGVALRGLLHDVAHPSTTVINRSESIGN